MKEQEKGTAWHTKDISIKEKRLRKKPEVQERNVGAVCSGITRGKVFWK